MIFALHFERRKYPAKPIIEAATAARKLDRKQLISCALSKKAVTDDVDNNVFLITIFHPIDHSVREIAH